jgi:antitoxin FitA
MSTSTLTIRNLPEDVLATIRSRAQRSGESMQAYVWKRLVADASRPTPAEIVERARLRLAAGEYPTQPVDVQAYMDEGQA